MPDFDTVSIERHIDSFLWQYLNFCITVNYVVHVLVRLGSAFVFSVSEKRSIWSERMSGLSKITGKTQMRMLVQAD